jgi:hypothetical protein
VPYPRDSFTADQIAVGLGASILTVRPRGHERENHRLAALVQDALNERAA